MIKIELNLVQGDYGFEAKDAGGHIVKIDAAETFGGQSDGVRPMQLLLMGLGGCSGIDIISILKKQRQTVQSFAINIEAERENNNEPSLWKTATIVFEFTGNIDPMKAQKACDLSMQKYCSVAETLRRGGTQLNWEVRVGNLNTKSH